MLNFFQLKAQSDYIDHPNAEDTLCIYEVQLAKKDFNSGLLKFYPGAVWDFPYARMFDELDSLCQLYGLVFNPYSGMEQDVGIPGQTFGCYNDFMDREIAKRFGDGFEKKLIDEADSIFISKHINDTLRGYLCDESFRYCKPYDYTLEVDDLASDFFSNFIYPANCQINSSCKGCDIRVDFVVDTNGHAFNYEFCCTEDISLTIPCLDEIKKNIIGALEKISCWKPGELDHHKVVSTRGFIIDIVNRTII